MMNKKDVLETALKAVTGDRANTYGNTLINHAEIAALWSAYIGQLITPHQVVMMMVLLKVARTKRDPNHMDNYVDMAGYAAVGADVQTILKSLEVRKIPSEDQHLQDGSQTGVPSPSTGRTGALIVQALSREEYSSAAEVDESEDADHQWPPGFA